MRHIFSCSRQLVLLVVAILAIGERGARAQTVTKTKETTALPAALQKYVRVLPADVVLYHWTPRNWSAAVKNGKLPPINDRGLGTDRTGYVNELGKGLYFFDNPLTGARYGDNNGSGGSILRVVLKKGSKVFVMPRYVNTGSTSSGGGRENGTNSARLMLGDDTIYKAFKEAVGRGLSSYGVDALLAVEWDYALKAGKGVSAPTLSYVNVVNAGAVKSAAFDGPRVELEMLRAAAGMPTSAAHVNVQAKLNLHRNWHELQQYENSLRQRLGTEKDHPQRLMDVICNHLDFAANMRTPLYQRTIDPSLLPPSWL